MKIRGQKYEAIMRPEKILRDANIDHAFLTRNVAVIDRHFSDWSTATNIELVPGSGSEHNTEFNDGCPRILPNEQSHGGK